MTQGERGKTGDHGQDGRPGQAGQTGLQGERGRGFRKGETIVLFAFIIMVAIISGLLSAKAYDRIDRLERQVECLQDASACTGLQN